MVAFGDAGLSSAVYFVSATIRLSSTCGGIIVRVEGFEDLHSGFRVCETSILLDAPAPVGASHTETQSFEESLRLFF